MPRSRFHDMIVAHGCTCSFIKHASALYFKMLFACGGECMIALNLTDIKKITTHLFLKDTFDSFSFIEGEIITFNAFRIDGYIQKDFFDTGAELPEYSPWKNLRQYCFAIIKGRRTPLSFHFIFSLSQKNIEKLVIQNAPELRPENVQGLYMNLHFNGKHLTCVTGTSFKTFTMDKTLEHVWDEMVEKFFRTKELPFEKQ